MRDRILIGLIALTLAAGSAAVASTSTAADHGDATDVPSVDAPAPPELPEIAVPEEDLTPPPLTRMELPTPRYESPGHTVLILRVVEVPPAPPRIDEPEAPDLDFPVLAC